MPIAGQTRPRARPRPARAAIRQPILGNFLRHLPLPRSLLSEVAQLPANHAPADRESEERRSPPLVGVDAARTEHLRIRAGPTTPSERSEFHGIEPSLLAHRLVARRWSYHLSSSSRRRLP